MPNLLQRGASFLGTRLKEAAGREVTYKRGPQEMTATGWPAKIDYEVTDDETGIPQKVSFYDWTFTTEDLAFDGDDTIFAARPGDQITETLNGEELTYEASSPGKRPVAESADSAGVLTMIHTKIVRRCPAS